MSLVTLAVAKDHLGIVKDDTDQKVQRSLDAAESYIARRIGAGSTLAAQTVTQRATGYRAALALTTLPVVSVTSITGSDGVLVPLSGLDIDLPAGLIRMNSTYYYATPFYPFMLPWYTVVYQAGFTALDPDYVQAVLEGTRYFWGAQRGPATGSEPFQAKATLDDLVAALPVYGTA